MDSMQIPALLGFVAACALAASSGVFFRPGEWYESLRKPWWRPPNWLFGPAWTVLYLTIAVSGWLVWRDAVPGAALWPLTVYFVSLGLNAAWSGLFFGLRRPDIAFAEVLLLWGSILATILIFLPVQRTAALLLLPYLAWVSFAALLNLSIWRRNADRIGSRCASA